MSQTPLEAVSAARWRIAISLTVAMMVAYFGFILLVAFNKPLLGNRRDDGPEPRHAARRARDRGRLGADVDLHQVGQHALRRVAERSPPMTSLGEPNVTAIVFFAVFIALSLGITVWASRKTRTTDQFYAAGRSVTAFQNGLALAGDYMSAASFLGIAGLVALSGFDGLIYSIGWLVGWPIVMFLIAEPLRNLGRYTFADVRRGPPAADADPHRGVDWRAGRHLVLSHRADGRRGQPDSAAVRPAVRIGRRHRRRRDAGLRAVRRDDRDDVGADRQGRAAAGRRDAAGRPRAHALRLQSAGALRAGRGDLWSGVLARVVSSPIPSTRCRSAWR